MSAQSDPTGVRFGLPSRWTPPDRSDVIFVGVLLVAVLLAMGLTGASRALGFSIAASQVLPLVFRRQAPLLVASVIERRHEHALLRGLGLTRLQLRSTLLLEGVLLAAVACVIGVGLGVVYAYLGVMTVLPERSSVRLAVPLERLGLIVAVALIAGLLASVLPARRAAKVSPVEGLAAV